MLHVKRPPSTLPAAAYDTSPVHDIPPQAVLRFLAEVERLPEGATGALVFASAGTDVGRVLLERGRICWAAATTMRRRLTDILRHQSDPPLSVTRVEDVYATCRESRVPLGQALVAAGIVSEAGLRRALRQHTAESVALIAVRARQPGTWIPHSAHGYDSRFTFPTTELLASLGALVEVEAATEARQHLKALIPEETYAAGFVVHGGEALPIAEVGWDGHSVKDLVNLGRWVVEALHEADSWRERAKLVTCRQADGRTAVAWAKGALLLAALCEERASATRLTGDLLRNLEGWEPS